MSMCVCQECDTYIDNDDDPDSIFEQHGEYHTLCGRCREKYECTECGGMTDMKIKSELCDDCIERMCRGFDRIMQRAERHMT